ncbi:hypothetical protein JH06_1116 [Blastocystis sp. subtype 4]|uniref:hypothetical protein n=1 Tax=Blastocystis sp. subtype 4 TaxID=944170 RepID=UPI000711AE85|nr:hypothetical protein JH06_1116 [Blastocystis sp. subtype 4]KNB45811.1 hypothetical protein JH06_1116 [Blastocystis sp. subtype 4]|eukprot:XP_014529254.1 hypothetical protein JH06_1116 [Blastocystis sp. subtype 4]
MSESWTLEQQQALDEALKTYPATMDRRERWKYSVLRLIASKVPGKTMRECISRAKALVDLAKAEVANELGISSTTR